MSDTIQTYLRIRPVSQKVEYDIESSFSSSTITFRSYDRALKVTSGDVNNSKVEWQYKFNGIMDTGVQQQEVFERVAKDCVLKAMDGYNATIFAYGQTGSGKTWSITGGHGAYEERGLLQRSISLVYDEIEKRSDREWTVKIQFIEVYNGRGYDLLGRRDGQTPTHLGELERAYIREDQMGVAKLINVRDKPAPTEDDALNCLFEGDSNRVMCATSQNPNSSRSHVVFIMEITSTEPGSSEAQVSKLNIVDLAGSERAFKNDGVNPLQQLNEARAINGSLFYLEQCIQALSQKQAYVPYRNSFITNLLKDSIGGNCKTVMLATINPDPNQFAESMSTCKFAMRVASIKQVAKKNTVVDPFVRIRQLKKKIKALKERLAFYENGEQTDQELDANERAVVLERVREFVATPDMEVINLGGNFGRVQEAFRIFRSLLKKENIVIPQQRKYADEEPDEEEDMASSPKKNGKALQSSSGTMEIPADVEKQLKNLQSAISLRDIEIDILVSMITKKQQDRVEAGIQTQTSDLATGIPSPSSSRISEVERAKPTLSKEAFLDNIHSQAQLAHDQASPKKIEYRNRKLEEYTKAVGMMDRAQAFEQFRRSYRKNEVIERCKQQLKDKFAEAKELGARINAARIDIGSLKGRLIQLRSERAAQGLIDSSENKDEEVSPEEQELIEQIRQRKEQYTGDFETLKEKKKEIQFLNKNLDRSRIKLQQDFEKWFQSTDFSSVQHTHTAPPMDDSGYLRPQHTTSVSSTSPKSSFSSSPKHVSSFSPRYRAKQAWGEPSSQPPPSDRSSFYESVRSSHTEVSRSPRSSYGYENSGNSTLTHDNLRRLSGVDSYSDRSSAFESAHSRYQTSSDYGARSTSTANGGLNSSYMSSSSGIGHDRDEPPRTSTVSGLNPNNPLLQKLAGYMKMSETAAQSRPNGNDNRRSLLSRAMGER